MSRVRKKTSQKAKDDRPSFRKYFRRYWQLYAMMALPFCWLLLFKYGPMLGNILAFRRFKPLTGPYGVSWAEPPLRYFRQFLGQKQFWQAFRNTLIISIMNLAVNFPVPIIFAILLNELRNLKIKSFVQTVSYIPRFISTAVVISILAELLSPSTGMINQVLNAVFHIPPVYYMNEPGYFRFLYILTDMWQYTGWTAIIYLAAIAGINKELFESARIDGASRFQQIRYIMLPSIMPTIMVMFILSVGTLLSLGYEKVLLMQTPTNMVVSDIIDTYVYRLSLGAASPQYSLGSAVGLFNGVIGLILVSGANFLSKRLTGNSVY